MRTDLPHAICLALEQDYAKTQTIPSLEAEDTHFGTYFDQGPLTMELTDFIRSLGYNVQVSGPTCSKTTSTPFLPVRRRTSDSNRLDL